MNKRRLPAKKVRIIDLINGKYFPGDRGKMSPSYLVTPFGQVISRVNLIGSVIDKFVNEDESYSSLTLDDGTEAIRIKVFGDRVKTFEGIEPGDLVLVIGKLKEYNGEIYVNGEIVRKIRDPNLQLLRRLEILNELIEWKRIVKEIKEIKDKIPREELEEYVKNRYGMSKEALDFVLENLKVVREIDYKPKILELIDSLDEGDGVEISKILELSDLPENIIENAINELLASGMLFEPRPGILKRV